MASDKYGLKALPIGGSKDFLFSDLTIDIQSVSNSAWNYKRYKRYIFSVNRLKDRIRVTRIEASNGLD